MENIDFEYIYNRYRTRVVNIGKIVLHDEHEAEDVCQEVFEILYHMNGVLEYRDEKKLSNLISRISFHKALDHCRTAFRKHEYADSDTLMTMADMMSENGDSVDEVILALETAGYLQTIFQKLREKNRINYEIYVSVTLYGIPSRLVAGYYHITENNVNNRVMRTRRWLAGEYRKIQR